MNNKLRQVETDDVVIYSEHTYSNQILERCQEIFESLVLQGNMQGKFSDDLWITYSGVKHFLIRFALDNDKYNSHIGNRFGISKQTMENMLKCYAIYCNGVYIYKTIAREKIATIKKFLESYEDDKFRLKHEDMVTIEAFLVFINTPEKQIDSIVSNIKFIKSKRLTQRKLSPVINYLVIEREINSLYSKDLDEKTFKKWFPVFFWVNITFILPLRATEMLVTPKNFIEHRAGKTFIRVRRTKLKKGKRTVYYNVEKDYKIFEYEMPYTNVLKIIEKYMEMTRAQNRRFLFEYTEFMTNDMLSLGAFNQLLEDFMKERIIGNPKYDYAKYATGIKEFEAVTAGDSRPIAMANLYFQNVGADICRQLADHVKIDTSAGYYTNISQIIWASSIMEYQKRINNYANKINQGIDIAHRNALDIDKSICISPKRENDKSNIDDCISQNHLEDCWGCKYYIPAKKELDRFIDRQKEKVDESAKQAIEFLNTTASLKNHEISIEEIFLKVQTDATRFRIGCDIKAKEKGEKWQERRNSMKTFY